MGAWLVVFVLVSAFLRVEVSVKLVRVFFGIVTGFLEHFRAGGGSVTIPETTSASGLHWLLWSSCTSAKVCGLIRCRGNNVMRCLRASGAPQAADRVTCQSCLRPQPERMQIEY